MDTHLSLWIHSVPLNMLQYSVFSWEFPSGLQSDLALIHFFRSKTPHSSSEVCSTSTRAESSWAHTAPKLLNSRITQWTEWGVSLKRTELQSKFIFTEELCRLTFWHLRISLWGSMHKLWSSSLHLSRVNKDDSRINCCVDVKEVQ